MNDSIGTADDVMVTWREWKPQTDEAFIYSSWRNGFYYGANKHREPTEFFPEMTAIIKSILSRTDTQVRVACLKDAPEIILGYAVFTGDMHLEWAYVKEQFRAKGIGGHLCVNLKTVTPNLTKCGASIVKKKRLLIKGDSNEQGTTGNQ